MAKKRATPANHPYSSFDAIGVGAAVHLRMVGQSATHVPIYEDAVLRSEPTGKVGRKSASFYVPSLGQTIPSISEVQYVAWTRYE